MIKKFLLFLLVLILAAVVIFFAPAFLKPKLNYENTVSINKPPAEVWEKMMESENMGKWLKGFKSIETLSGEPGTVGSKYKIVIEEDGNRFEAIETVTEVVEDKRFAFTLDGEVLTNDVVVSLADKGLTTEYTQAETVEGKGFLMRAMFFWLQSEFSGRSKESLESFKKFAEEN
ncbi:MAG: SRPBCC family protein [Pyrinomonadaceae bacterium]|nr:SRPBCC family protein [Pyrinomonadaceae bacterium]